ncbi:MAG: hypothetical protein EOM26_00740 [Alphaproteobacteria bacterium]|nr:hypothetical protein [Alphaproteobacteria bacterium]
MQVTKGQIARYTLLPGILPRFFEMFGPGQGLIASWMALIYGSVRLLPPAHPYLRPSSRGKFGVRHVIGEAGRNLIWDLKHVDQIIVYFTLLAGFLMLLLQFLFFAGALFILPAFAIENYIGIDIPTSPLEIFVTDNPQQDIAFILLDLVFGVPDSGGGASSFFGSCIGTGGTGCTDTQGNVLPHDGSAFPFPFHEALREVWALYSYGLFLVGCLIIIYLVITTAGEMAASGTPFGRRFNRVWAPIRLMFFFFLIVPIVHNLNIAQMATLHIAKFGSSMATNAWIVFNEALVTGNTTILSGNTGTMGERWIVDPNVPEPGTSFQFLHTAMTCKYAERLLHNRYIQPYLVKGSPNPEARYFAKYPADDHVTDGIEPAGATRINLDEALAFFDNGDIVIRFGEYNPDLYTDHAGYVYPWCGELVLRNPGLASTDYGVPEKTGIWIAFMVGWDLLQQVWATGGLAPTLHGSGSNIARNFLLREGNEVLASDDLRQMIEVYRTIASGYIATAVRNHRTRPEFVVPDVLIEKGWAGAAIWYSRIAQLNGQLIDASSAVPAPKLWPSALEQIMEARRANNMNNTGTDRFDPNLADGKRVQFEREEEVDVARAERFTHNLWLDEVSEVIADGRPSRSHTVIHNPLIDSINAIFGTQGLFDMRENADVHPLAQLTGAGKMLVDKAFVAFGFSAGMSLGGGLWGILSGNPSPMIASMASIAKYVGVAGLLSGIILYYVVPFMPFIYFFFAVMGWVKAIFEAMVGVPLWALAHLRIDGDGLPGPTGMNGYFLLFEIFVRPVLIVFGLVASVSVLGAVVSVLNEIFELVVVNLTGRDPNDVQADDPTQLEFYRNAVDQFFYTIIYVIIVYMMALSCFKLIDLVPGNIMRWLGASIAVFGDAEKNAAGQITRLTSMGTTSAGMQVNEGLSGLQQGAFMGHFFGGK